MDQNPRIVRIIFSIDSQKARKRDETSNSTYPTDYSVTIYKQISVSYDLTDLSSGGRNRRGPNSTRHTFYIESGHLYRDGRFGQNNKNARRCYIAKARTRPLNDGLASCESTFSPDGCSIFTLISSCLNARGRGSRGLADGWARGLKD